MVPTQVVHQIGYHVPDPIADDAGKPDLPCEAKITKLPGVEVKQFGSLFLGESQLAVNQMVHLGQFIHDRPDNFLNQRTKFTSTQLKVRHNITHAQVEIEASTFEAEQPGCVKRSMNEWIQSLLQQVSKVRRKSLGGKPRVFRTATVFEG